MIETEFPRGSRRTSSRLQFSSSNVPGLVLLMFDKTQYVKISSKIKSYVSQVISQKVFFFDIIILALLECDGFLVLPVGRTSNQNMILLACISVSLCLASP